MSTKAAVNKQTGTTEADVAKPVMETSELEIITLAPEAIAINPQIASLRTNRTSPQYLARVKELAAAMKGDKQDTPVIVRFNTQTDPAQKDLGYELVAGHRRHEAAKLAGIDLICIFQEATDTDALRAAMQENIQREDFSALDRARFMSKLRTGGFPGITKMGTGEIANYLKISPASVTQSEKLLTLPGDIQQKVEDGGMSATAAIELAGAVKDSGKREAVAKKAQEKAEAEAVKKDKAREAKADKKAKEAEKAAAKKAAKAKKKGKPAPVAKKSASSKPVFKKSKPKIETKHVRAAMQEVQGAVEKAKAAQRAEVVALAGRFTTKAWPAPIQLLGKELAGYMSGKKTVAHVIAAMDDIADLIQVAVKAQKAGGKGKVKQMPKAKAVAKKKAKPKAKVKTKSKAVAKKHKAA